MIQKGETYMKYTYLLIGIGTFVLNCIFTLYYVRTVRNFAKEKYPKKEPIVFSLVKPSDENTVMLPDSNSETIQL